MEQLNPQIEASWLEQLKDEFRQEYFLQLKQFLLEEKKHYQVYPAGSRIFAAFDATPFQQVKVVILGQDPYHGAGQAHGLCFSVPEGVKPPPSLVNIFQELNQDLGIPVPKHGNLEKWARQGVLLLNATLTVRANQAGSHQHKGWELFTDQVIKALSSRREGLVFMLWGNYAQAKTEIIDSSRHHILKAAHPSPFSVYRGFYGCRHFSAANERLVNSGMAPIDWNLST
ncbi:MAG: uracil-DNA glycosylase [Bacteroidetes bacterium]|nr:uracil-DNA glycosylase [Bacteroidota bacterium]